MGFLNGQEMKWLPEAIGILRQELPDMEVIVSSKTSPELSNALVRGQIDVAFLRPDRQVADLEYRLLTKEPMVVVLPSDHRLAAAKEIDPRDLAGEPFVTVSKTAPMLRIVIDDYLRRLGLDFVTKVEVDNLSGAISLIASTRGVAILPIYAVNFLPWSVVSRPIAGETPTIDLALGYHRANNSPILRLFLSKADELIDRVSRQRS
jgi:LysR family hca operon transcriptional activator